MNWFQYIDAYCERVEPSFLAEPINAITNAAFFVAAFIVWRAAGKTGERDRSVSILAIMIAVIGGGSFLFHTFATAWAAALDVLPIAVFVLTALWLALRRSLDWSYGLSAASLLALIGATPGASRLVSQFTAGVGAYAGPWLALAAISIAAQANQREEAKFYAAATAVFTVSLTFRVIDLPLCERFPLGTHFMWHILNACVLAITSLGILRAGQTAGPHSATPGHGEEEELS